VSAVCIAVQPAGRNSDVEVLAVVGDRLQQMQQVQPQDAQFVGVVFEFDRQPLPQVRPGDHVRIPYVGKSLLAVQSSLGSHRRFGGGDVAPGDQRDDLRHGQRLARRQLSDDHVADHEPFVDESIRRERGRAVTPHGGPGGQRDRDLQLRRLDHQQHRVVRQGMLFQRP
jgi:hypothetical protein